LPDVSKCFRGIAQGSEKKVGEVLASLARLGYVTSDDGKTFALRCVA
jgi:hypothetical protein